MQFMMIMIPNLPEEMDANWEPPAEGLAAMTKYNEELSNAGVLLEANGLAPPSQAFRVTFGGGKAKITDGPFAEAKEVIGGYWLIEVSSRDEAIEWAKRIPIGGDGPVVEVRQIQSIEDFSPELRAAAEALA